MTSGRERWPVAHLAKKGDVVVVDGKMWRVTKSDRFSSRDGHLLCGCGWVRIVAPLEK